MALRWVCGFVFDVLAFGFDVSDFVFDVSWSSISILNFFCNLLNNFHVPKPAFMAIEMTKPHSIGLPPAGALLLPEPFVSEGGSGSAWANSKHSRNSKIVGYK